ncbi:hypothetical protein CRUP_033865, partial [Coryphaenoides rupestris]
MELSNPYGGALYNPITGLEEPKAAGGAGRSSRRRSGSPANSSKRRENHNYKERDRRRRIRMHCRELNSLVPFCTPTTDKATTLQWTTAFVRHIQDVYGDTLKENFESAFYDQRTSTDWLRARLGLLVLRRVRPSPRQPLPEDLLATVCK